jgi:hypothetical protein
VAHAVAPNRFLTLVQLAQARPAFSLAAYRDMRFKAFDRKNSRGEIIPGNGSGPAGVWVKKGAKVLADLSAFDPYIESFRMEDI